MTVAAPPAEQAPTATGPTVRSTWRRNRAAVAVGGVLVLALVLLAVLVGSPRSGTLDPDAYDPNGAHALAVLLRDSDVPVRRTTDVPGTVSTAGAGTTVLVPLPQLLSDTELELLGKVPGRLVVLGATPRELERLGLPARVTGVADREATAPGCDLAAAVAAGRVSAGGLQYRPTDGATGATSCYSRGDGATLLDLPSRSAVLLGSGAALTNAHLDEEGDAALALRLLAAPDGVVWLVPAPDRPELGAPPVTDPNDLLPRWVRAAALQLLLAAGVVALWRARRLGRVVPEPLPVVVRAAETVEGRGRLYRVAGAREAAAEALRAGARDRLSHRVGAPLGTTPEALCERVAARTGRSGASVQALLYGPPPGDDAALVRLADDLDDLDDSLSESLEVPGS